MNRPVRIALNIVGPPLIASLLLIATALLAIPFTGSSRPGELADAAGVIPFVLFFAYMLAGIPSIIHAALMEWLYHRYPAHTWKACAVSGVSGALAGILIDLTFLIASWRNGIDGWLFFYPTIGLIVGLLLGIAVKLLSEDTALPRTTSLRGCE